MLALAGLALVALAMAVAFWKWPGLFPGRGPAPGAAKALAVVEIENMSGDTSLNWLGGGVADMLTTDLAQARGLEVISTERVRSLISRRTKGQGTLPPSEAQDVAKDAQADVFLSGTLLKVGPRLRLNLRVQETGTGKVLYADKVEGDNAEAVMAMVDRATAGILSKLTPGEAPARLDVAASMTSNVEALRAYEEGRSYFDRTMSDKAAAAFRRATELDPQFAFAYLYLSNCLVQLGDNAGWPPSHGSCRAACRTAVAAPSAEIGDSGRASFTSTAAWRKRTSCSSRSSLSFPANSSRVSSSFSAAIERVNTQRSLPLRKSFCAWMSASPRSITHLAWAYGFEGDVPQALAAVDR